MKIIVPPLLQRNFQQYSAGQANQKEIIWDKEADAERIFAAAAALWRNTLVGIERVAGTFIFYFQFQKDKPVTPFWIHVNNEHIQKTNGFSELTFVNFNSKLEE
jgi:hypothetical protein